MSAIAGVIGAAAAVSVTPASYRGLMTWHNARLQWLLLPRYASSEVSSLLGGITDGNILKIMAATHAKRPGLPKAPQPTILPPNKRYIRADARTIKALILSSHGTTDDTKFKSNSLERGPDGHRGGITAVLIRIIGTLDSENIIVAHIEAAMRINLTKEDVDGITSGYPLWDRDSMTLLGSGGKVSSPIRNYSDNYRGGWLIGVGITNDLPLVAAPRSRSFADRPMRRLVDILNTKIYLALPYENVSIVAEAVARMIENETQSGVSVHSMDDQGLLDAEDETNRFSESEATFAMHQKNPPNIPLTNVEIARIEPMLVKVLCASFMGAYKVVAALKNLPAIPEFVLKTWKSGPPGHHGWC